MADFVEENWVTREPGPAEMRPVQGRLQRVAAVSQ
jgi:hypothetical protein